MATPAKPGWYDDPDDSNAQRYWDGQGWTPHRQRKPASKAARPPAMPTPPQQPLPPPNLPPALPPDQQQRWPPPDQASNGGPPQRSRAATKIVGVIGAVAALAVAGVVVAHKFVPPHSKISPDDRGTHSQQPASPSGGPSPAYQPPRSPGGGHSPAYQDGYQAGQEFANSPGGLAGPQPYCGAFSASQGGGDPQDTQDWEQGCLDGFAKGKP